MSALETTITIIIRISCGSVLHANHGRLLDIGKSRCTGKRGFVQQCRNKLTKLTAAPKNAHHSINFALLLHTPARDDRCHMVLGNIQTRQDCRRLIGRRLRVRKKRSKSGDKAYKKKQQKNSSGTGKHAVINFVGFSQQHSTLKGLA